MSFQRFWKYFTADRSSAQRQRPTRRVSQCEPLEARCLLAGDAGGLTLEVVPIELAVEVATTDPEVRYWAVDRLTHHYPEQCCDRVAQHLLDEHELASGYYDHGMVRVLVSRQGIWEEESASRWSE